MGLYCDWSLARNRQLVIRRHLINSRSSGFAPSAVFG
jgi:hypothetical protein